MSDNYVEHKPILIEGLFQFLVGGVAKCEMVNCLFFSTVTVPPTYLSEMFFPKRRRILDINGFTFSCSYSQLVREVTVSGISPKTLLKNRFCS